MIDKIIGEFDSDNMTDEKIPFTVHGKTTKKVDLCLSKYMEKESGVLSMRSKKFDYKLELDEALDPEFAKYINSLFSVPRIKLNNDKIRKRFEKEFIQKHSYYGDLGYQGEFFSGPPIGEVQEDPVEYVKPDSQPDIFCHWIIKDDHQTLKFDDDDSEFFGIYYRPDIDPLWIKYLIQNFFEPNGYFLNGWIEDDKNKWIISKNHMWNRIKSGGTYE